MDFPWRQVAQMMSLLEGNFPVLDFPTGYLQGILCESIQEVARSPKFLKESHRHRIKNDGHTHTHKIKSSKGSRDSLRNTLSGERLCGKFQQ